MLYSEALQKLQIFLEKTQNKSGQKSEFSDLSVLKKLQKIYQGHKLLSDSESDRPIGNHCRIGQFETLSYVCLDKNFQKKQHCKVICSDLFDKVKIISE